jgi:hypothetical protein
MPTTTEIWWSDHKIPVLMGVIPSVPEMPMFGTALEGVGRAQWESTPAGHSIYSAAFLSVNRCFTRFRLFKTGGVVLPQVV